MSEDTKTCPFCAETIKAAAIVCRFCNRDLAGAEPEQAAPDGADPAEMQEAKRLGIEWSEKDNRWTYKGSYFGALGPAIQFAKTGQHAFSTGPASPPAPEPKKTNWLLWIIVIPVVLFFGSAIIAGITESNEASRDQERAKSLTDELTLITKISDGIREGKWSAEMSCWYLAAATYRLAEARSLNIDIERAIHLTNTPVFAEEFAKTGQNTHHVIRGLATQVWSSPLSPQASFDARLESCARRR